MPIITKEQLEQASVDANYLRRFRVGPSTETIPTEEGLKPTIAGIVQQALQSASLDTIPGKSFTTGATLINQNQGLLDSSSGEYYRWTGTFPDGGVVVPANSTPSSTGGIGPGKWLNAGSGALKIDLSNGVAPVLLNRPDSKNFWIDVHPDAKIHRINDRVFIGSASKNDGKILTDRNLQNKDWLEALYRSSTTNNTQFAAFSEIGQCAVLGASRTSDSGLADSLGCIGGQFWGINDNTTQVQTAYAAYFESRRAAGAGRTHGFEIDLINFGNAVSVQPYDMFQQGLTAGAWIASGGELSATKASVAIAIMNNGSTWDKGIVFHSTSLEGTNGINGSGVAMEMAKGHAIRWMYGSGSTGMSMTSSVSTAVAEQNINFSDAGLLYRNSNGVNMFQVGVSNNYVNGINLTPGSTGTGPTMIPIGADTNIDFRFGPKGTGQIDLRGVGLVGTGGAQAGYIPIKLNGNSYKLAIYAV